MNFAIEILEGKILEIKKSVAAMEGTHKHYIYPPKIDYEMAERNIAELEEAIKILEERLKK